MTYWEIPASELGIAPGICWESLTVQPDTFAGQDAAMAMVCDRPAGHDGSHCGDGWRWSS